ncbi:MAG TPA: anti-sigma factor [Planctomycetota bacterium]|nr:anti-sigma factor [Planctomycetota bacterium]
MKSRLMERIAPPAQRSAPVFTRVFWGAAAIFLFSLIVVALRRTEEPHPIVFVPMSGFEKVTGEGLVRGSAVEISISALPPLPPGKCYQLWHIGSNQKPVPQATFHLDPAGMLRGCDGMKKAVGPGHVFAITMEPDAGSETPTMPILAIAKY